VSVLSDLVSALVAAVRSPRSPSVGADAEIEAAYYSLATQEAPAAAQDIVAPGAVVTTADLIVGADEVVREVLAHQRVLRQVVPDVMRRRGESADGAEEEDEDEDDDAELELRKTRTFNDRYVLQFLDDMPLDATMQLDRLRTESETMHSTTALLESLEDDLYEEEEEEEDGGEGADRHE